jgi:predicted enzyme related to lactoylglutathione lyase
LENEKIVIFVVGLALFVALGCAPKNISKEDPSPTGQFKTHGMVSWYELMTADVEASKKFYSKLFGWVAEDVKAGGMPYTVVKVSGKELGGMMGMPPEAKGWGIYVTVDDVDATAGLAETLGATILVSPRDIPDVGRFCVIKDPQGAVISVITYKMR